MKKIFIGAVLSLIISTQGLADTGWVKAKPYGSVTPTLMDDAVRENNDALDLLLSKYREGAKVTYASAATLTVGPGQVVTSNSAATIRLMGSNSASTTVSWSDLDAGSEAVSTTYYVYAVMSALTDTTFTFKISVSPSAPSGVTYYLRLGSFYNNSSGNITLVSNDNDYYGNSFGNWEGKSTGVDYQSSTDGFVLAIPPSATADSDLYGYTGSASPDLLVAMNNIQNSMSTSSITFPVKGGHYWKVTVGGNTGTATVYWLPAQS